MRRLVGAYLNPRGVSLVEVRDKGGGTEIVRSVEETARLGSAAEAVRHLVRSLDTAGMDRADVAVVLRGFDVAHHTLSLPPAPTGMLAPIIDREVRRLEPQMTDPAVAWLPLPDDDGADQPPQKHFIVGALPRATTYLIESTLRDGGHALLHLTALPAAFQRLAEDFDPSTTTSALLVPLPDGLFLGLFLGGGMRIAIEPPLLEQESPDGAAMAEEAELGATYVRQQFRGAQIERAVIAGPSHLWPDTQSLLIDRLGVTVDRLDLNGLSTGSLAALGALLDARSASPLALAGQVAARRERQATAALRQTTYAAITAAVVVAGWALWQGIEARRADRDVREARSRMAMLTATVGPVRQTAEQRRLVRDANAMVRMSARDREALQSALAAISGGIVGAIGLDSLQLDRGSNGWVAALGGTAAGATSGGAVQALHDFYRTLPSRVAVEELALQDMVYVDTTAANGRGALVRFQLTFVLPERAN